MLLKTLANTFKKSSLHYLDIDLVIPTNPTAEDLEKGVIDPVESKVVRVSINGFQTDKQRASIESLFKNVSLITTPDSKTEAVVNKDRATAILGETLSTRGSLFASAIVESELLGKKSELISSKSHFFKKPAQIVKFVQSL